jgi:hypothetical protein
MIPSPWRCQRDAEDLGYLGVREALHVTQDQRCPVLGAHVLEGILNLLAALHA